MNIAVICEPEEIASIYIFKVLLIGRHRKSLENITSDNNINRFTDVASLLSLKKKKERRS